ncbi:MAG TPA: S41 family peptidase [Nitrososphaera sp.]|nr:S41 family peptidase [Nitrososphaera sp.]
MTKGKRTHKGTKPLLADVVDLPTFLKTTGKLSHADRQVLVEQALILLEMFYVHMPLKRAMHAIDPIQRLKLLKYRLAQKSEKQKMSEVSFHNEMTRIFTSLRDLHANYMLPLPYGDKVAFLPFQIEEYYEGEQRKYIVSKLASGFNHPTFKPGVEVQYWNGVPIEREVELNADRQAGSNLEARHARGLDSLTIRPMTVSLPPDEEWVVIGYRSLDGQQLELKQKWLVFSPERALGSVNPDALTNEATAMGIDIKTYMIQQGKKVLFAPEVVASEKRIARGEISRAAPPKGFETSMPNVFSARSVETLHGTYGYIRIYTFNVDDDDAFISEFIRLEKLLPQNGLIIDVRDNGGGLIYASERLFQIITPRHIKPEPVQFINTPLTYELCRRNSPSRDLDLSPWLESIEQAVETGATFSQSFPITPEEFCNNIGQVYNGPVVLITDALCYSATDIFAAGFQDHKIGPILGTSGNTGAGGANVWTHDLLKRLMGNSDSPLKSLPKGAGMRVSIRRTLRVHEREGTPLEDLGVIPDYVHKMTKDDVLNGNIDLINDAASILAKLPLYTLSVDVISSDTEKLTVKTETENISRLDVFIDDRPQLSIDIINNSSQFVLKRPLHEAHFLEFRGFKDGNLVAVRRANL